MRWFWSDIAGYTTTTFFFTCFEYVSKLFNGPSINNVSSSEYILTRMPLGISLLFLSLFWLGCLNGASVLGHVYPMDDVWQFGAYGATVSVILNCPDTVTTSSEFSVMLTLRVDELDTNVDCITDYMLFFGYFSLGGGQTSGGGNDVNLTSGQSFATSFSQFEIKNDKVGLWPGESIIFPVQVTARLTVISTVGTRNQVNVQFTKNIILVAGSDAPTDQSYLYIYRLIPGIIGVIILFIVLIVGIHYKRTHLH